MVASTDHMASTLKVNVYDFDPDDADANDVAWVDMRDFTHFWCFFVRTVGTGALDTFKILANSESDGSGTDSTIATHAVASEPDAVADWVQLECSAIQLAETGTDLRYVTASCEFATSTDEGVVIYIRKPKRVHDALTADSIA